MMEYRTAFGVDIDAFGNPTDEEREQLKREGFEFVEISKCVYVNCPDKGKTYEYWRKINTNVKR